MKLNVEGIKHKLVDKIKGILQVKKTRLRGKEYLVKYTCCHHNEAIWMKLAHLDHLPNMVNKFKQEKGYEFGMKRT
jgi:hypothetical protein